MHARCASVISQKPVWGFNVIFIPLWPISSGHYKYFDGHAHANATQGGENIKFKLFYRRG